MFRSLSELLWLLSVSIWGSRPLEIVLPLRRMEVWFIGCVIPIGDMSEREIGMLRSSFDARRMRTTTAECVIAGRSQKCLTALLELERGTFQWHAVNDFTDYILKKEVFEDMSVSVRTRRYGNMFARLGQEPRASPYLPVTQAAQEI